MGELTAAFHAARGSADQSPAEPGLEETLAALHARGRAAHPEVTVDGPLFASHLARCGAVVSNGGAAARAEDLYLACGGLLGDATAVATLRRAHRPVIVGYLRQIDVSAAFVDEVEQRLWDQALVGTSGTPPKLATYSGQGALAGWVGIAAQRIALMMHRHEAAEERAADGAAAQPDLGFDDPELAFMKEDLRSKFRSAISRAVEALDDRERMVYRLHIVEGLTVEAIGRIYAVNHSTVSRWLGKARDAVVAEAQRLMREEMDLSPAEFDSVAPLLVSRLDLSVSRILQAPR